jgi:Tol biopolymer transport system component
VAETNGQNDVWVADVSVPSRMQNITRGRLPRSRGLRWSPDGERLALVSEEPVPDAGLGDSEVYVVDLRDLALHQVTVNDSLDEHTSWSADGASLLIASNRPNQGRVRYAVGTAASDLARPYRRP